MPFLLQLHLSIEMIDLLEGITTFPVNSKSAWPLFNWNDWPAWRDYDEFKFRVCLIRATIEMIDLLEGITTRAVCLLFLYCSLLKWLTCLKGLRHKNPYWVPEGRTIEMIDLLEGITTQQEVDICQNIYLLKWLTCLKGLRRYIQPHNNYLDFWLKWLTCLKGLRQFIVLAYSQDKFFIEMIDLLEGITTSFSVTASILKMANWNDWPAWRDYDLEILGKCAPYKWIEMIDLLEGITTQCSHGCFVREDADIEMIDLLEGITTVKGATNFIAPFSAIEMIDLLEGITTGKQYSC